MDLLQSGAAWLDAQRKAYASHSITYTSGAYSVTVSASVGKTIFQIDDGYGVIVRDESKDFLITVADLILNGVNVKPRRGDKIVEMIGTASFTHEVVAPGKEPDWRYTDGFKQTFRVHTKVIGVA